MTRVVFFGYPARGHTTPSLPVVAEFVRRGATVEYHSTPTFQGLVETAGARFLAYPPGDEALATASDTDDHLARLLAATEAMLPALLAGQAEAPDLVVFDASSLWGGVVARRLGRPCVASVTTFALTRPMLQLLGAPVRPGWSSGALDRLNTAYDANFRDHLDVMAPVADLKFVYTARAFQPAGRFLDESYRFLGPLMDQRPRDGARIQARGSRPLAYVSLGTIFNRDHGLLLQISEVLAARGWQVIVSLGDAQAAHRVAWPEHVQAHAFVDQIGVLAQARLFVTHGGMNSVSEALSHAVPMIVIPQAVDQHIVARQTANLGAAVVIERQAVSAESLSVALARIDERRAAFESAARSLQRSLSETQSVAEAVDQALGLADGGRHG